MKRIDLRERLVSFGANIKRPKQLETRSVGDILEAIRDGEWRREIEMLRSLRGEEARERAKLKLPFFTPSGEFLSKENGAIKQYSGLAVVDFDDLTANESKRLLHSAVDDPHCFAAFRSPSGTGFKVLFRVPLDLGAIHGKIFDQILTHVRRDYGISPDKKNQNDVSRACFVSWDSEMFVRPTAKKLPIKIPSLVSAPSEQSTTKPAAKLDWKLPSKFKKSIGKRQPFDWDFNQLGRQNAPIRPKPGADAHFTNKSLLKLARLFATDVKKRSGGKAQIERWAKLAFLGWWREARWKGVAKPCAVYWKEFAKMVQTQLNSNHADENASKWTRWRKHPDFPGDGTSRDQILFAIRKHCEESGKAEFFLSMRSAGPIAEISHVMAGRHLERLRQDGVIAHRPGWNFRHREGSRAAQDWILVGFGG